MVVILCGVDGVGKTTCIDELCHLLDFRRIKETYPGAGKSKRALSLELLEERLKKKDLIYIYDRCTCIDDFVYEPVMNDRETDLFDEDLFQRSIQALQQCVIIQLKCDIGTLHSRFDARGDDYVSKKQLGSIMVGYDKFFNNTLCKKPYEIISTAEDSPEDTAAKVLAIINGLTKIENKE